ncbi:MAG TPA: TrpB-like pyridoxal phosphate-dependent enzyme [Candidatus Caldiarchaeum subterraneum]|uniref:Tryptophan synthase beta chain n=1 Tax=Caldiarchaeum subterraneum TaxID=311458 RepID=A0A833EC07_CALS0|nr:TrpB-like pyridoxal phosphate-dependent enzyme [Aigarchaeota archaeon]HIQ29824.1 TrpB-like pyridoxal phosphate-dependent enzyme [Candidatus Caldarchaeum subterraneum]
MATLPNRWYNILPDLPKPLPPPRDPESFEEYSRIENLPKLFPAELLDQEISPQRYIEIPDAILEAYKSLGRPTPLIRAKRLEQLLNTPAQIFYKREDTNPTGSHKPNTALPQAYYAYKENSKYLVTETGAGQWGSAVALAASLFGLRCLVFMTRSSYLQKPYRRYLMSIYGAEVLPSPSGRTKPGSELLREDPEHPGSLGIAISEAVETVLGGEGYRYAVGSVMNFTLIHQSVIGLEAVKQMEEEGLTPDVVVACVGGGSNFAGIAFPMLGAKLSSGDFRHTRFVAVESSAAPRMTGGKYCYEFADTAGIMPMLKMYNVGRGYVPPPVHAAGLRYHGLAPAISLLLRERLVEPRAYSQEEAFEAARVFARAEGVLPAPETAHAVRYVIEEAVECRRRGRGEVILLCLSGHGLLDLQSYGEVLKL